MTANNSWWSPAIAADLQASDHTLDVGLQRFANAVADKGTIVILFNGEDHYQAWVPRAGANVAPDSLLQSESAKLKNDRASQKAYTMLQRRGSRPKAIDAGPTYTIEVDARDNILQHCLLCKTGIKLSQGEVDQFPVQMVTTCLRLLKEGRMNLQMPHEEVAAIVSPVLIEEGLVSNKQSI